MQHDTTWLQTSLVYLAAAVVAVPLSRLLGLGSVIGYLAAGVAIGGFGYLWAQAGRFVIHGSPQTVVARVRTNHNGVVDVRRRHLAESSINPASDGSLELHLRFKNGAESFTGAEAERVASIILPKVNRFGGKKQEVADADEALEATEDSGADPLAAMSQAQLVRGVGEALGQLTPLERSVFVLRHLEQRSLDEIARTLSSNANACKQAIFRAVRKLRAHLAHFEGATP